MNLNNIKIQIFKFIKYKNVSSEQKIQTEVENLSHTSSRNIIITILIINSNSVNRRRKIKKESEFIQNLILRKLDFTSDTEVICSKGSEELKNYYLTRDDDSIGIKNDKIESEEKEKHVDALINLVASQGDTNENVKEYVMHLIPVLVILVLAILSIPGWIFLCSCSCCGCCCCSNYQELGWLY
jgi:hypothetical protein